MKYLLSILFLLITTLCPAQEITTSFLTSYGHYQVFGGKTGASMTAISVEYDRPSWGHVKGLEVDYVADVFPSIVLRQAAVSDQYGNPLTNHFENVFGIGIAPLGFRFIKRGKEFSPYFVGKFGMLGFTKKALYKDATYENFLAESGFGIDVHFKGNFYAKLDAFDFLHFSNANISYNPGADLMTSSIGIRYNW